jgi:hypothetical protein
MDHGLVPFGVGKGRSSSPSAEVPAQVLFHA